MTAPISMELTISSSCKHVKQNLSFNCSMAPDIIPVTKQIYIYIVVSTIFWCPNTSPPTHTHKIYEKLYYYNSIYTGTYILYMKKLIKCSVICYIKIHFKSNSNIPNMKLPVTTFCRKVHNF